MNIGKIVVENVVFLVFPDDQLSFPQIGYKISGILGYPVTGVKWSLTAPDIFVKQ
jgi:hypothetical protein